MGTNEVFFKNTLMLIAEGFIKMFINVFTFHP